jgi:hypothetical protein
MSNEIAIVTTWEEFREKWMGGAGRQNFLLRGEVFPCHFESPPLQKILEEVCANESTRILRGVGSKEEKPGPYPDFDQLPLEQAVNAKALVAHFDAQDFAGPGQVFEGLGEIFDGWYGGLREHGFSWNEPSAQRALFWSGPNCHSGYHYDSSYVLAWQVVGRKRFCWLKEPEKWCPYEVRRDNADFYDRMPCPEGITLDDVIECEMQPGDVLWNVMLTPHWVYSLDETCYSFNLTHFDFHCDGKASPIEEELSEIRRERARQQEVLAAQEKAA